MDDLNTSLSTTVSEMTGVAAVNLTHTSVVQERSKILLLNQRKIQARFSQLKTYTTALAKAKEKVESDKKALDIKCKTFSENYNLKIKGMKSQYESLKDELLNLQTRTTEISIKRHSFENSINQNESEIRGIEAQEALLAAKIPSEPTELIKTLVSEIKNAKILTDELDLHIRQIKDAIKSHNDEKIHIIKELSKEREFTEARKNKILAKKIETKELEDKHEKDMDDYVLKMKGFIQLKKDNKAIIEESGSKRDNIENKINEFDKQINEIEAIKNQKKEKQMKLINEIKQIKNNLRESKAKLSDVMKEQKRKDKIEHTNDDKLLDLNVQHEIVLSSIECIQREQAIANDKLDYNLNALNMTELKLKIIDMNKEELQDLINKTEKDTEAAKAISEKLVDKLDSLYREKLSSIDKLKVEYNKAKDDLQKVVDQLKIDIDNKRLEKVKKQEANERRKEKIEKLKMEYDRLLLNKSKIEEDVKNGALLIEKIMNTMRLTTSKTKLEIESWERSNDLQESRLKAWNDNFIDNMLSCSKSLVEFLH